MTDRELIEAAAKAAGQERSAAGDLWSNARGMLWDPLTDDGDAFRLAVTLGLFVRPEFFHFLGLERFAQQHQDDVAAYRRAIVRAAAALHDGGNPR